MGVWEYVGWGWALNVWTLKVERSFSHTPSLPHTHTHTHIPLHSPFQRFRLVPQVLRLGQVDVGNRASGRTIADVDLPKAEDLWDEAKALEG